ncbi:MAG: glycine cleavage system protein H [Crenarchaeota archaeon]|nr:glycine cleavage system protein H [Thermoproteota archaeon]
MKVHNYEFPEDLYYHKEDHLWVKAIEKNKVRIGIDDFAAKESGRIDFVDLPRIGEEFSKGDVIVTIESGKWVGRLRSPVSGKVLYVNERLYDDPSLINRSPYDEGWLLVIEAYDVERDIGDLIAGTQTDKIKDWIEREIKERLGR